MQTAFFAQVDSLNKAIDCYNVNNLKCARTAIDAASKHSETSNDLRVHLLRGFIYKDIYKSPELNSLNVPARTEAINSLFKFLSYDSAKKDENYDAAIKTLRYLVSTYYNDAGLMLNPTQYKTAIEYYEMYDKYMTKIESTWDYKPMFKDFYMGLGSALNDYFESDRAKYSELADVISNSYKKVITIDTAYFSAYFNLGMLYHNMGVAIITESGDEIDISEIDKIQDKALYYFKLSLPYMLKAYALNPKRKEVLVALAGIYFSLHEEEKSAAIKAELDKLGK
jgi:tetratricopeptide (TPR) repeat protein